MYVYTCYIFSYHDYIDEKNKLRLLAQVLYSAVHFLQKCKGTDWSSLFINSNEIA